MRQDFGVRRRNRFEIKRTGEDDFDRGALQVVRLSWNEFRVRAADFAETWRHAS